MMLVPITTFQPDIDILIISLLRARTEAALKNLLTLDTVYYLCQTARSLFMSEPVVLDLSTANHKRIVVLGDIHGQYFDLLKHIDSAGIPPDTTYLVLGDYVDRGKYSIEVACLLYALKIKYPINIYIIRGDHECSRVNRRNGFYEECVRRFGTLYVWNAFVSTFNVLPFAAIIDQSIFCVHGGLSPLLESVSQLRKIERPVDIPHEGLIRDLVWADFYEPQNGFGNNEIRDCSIVFGKQELNRFLDANELKLMVRGHEVVQRGFVVEGRCVTVFSACQYKGVYNNAGATLVIEPHMPLSFNVISPPAM